MSTALPFRVILIEADVGGGPAAEFTAELIGTAAGLGYAYIGWVGGGERNGVNALQTMRDSASRPVDVGYPRR